VVREKVEECLVEVEVEGGGCQENAILTWWIRLEESRFFSARRPVST
jgi:hypothetical protein